MVTRVRKSEKKVRKVRKVRKDGKNLPALEMTQKGHQATEGIGQWLEVTRKCRIISTIWNRVRRQGIRGRVLKAPYDLKSDVVFIKKHGVDREY
jgi:hypothetical protein